MNKDDGITKDNAETYQVGYEGEKEVEEEEEKNTPMVEEPMDNSNQQEQRSYWKLRAITVLLAVVIVVIVSIVVTQNKPPIDPPDTVNYETGVSLITYYGIEATIRNRLAQTKVTMEIGNALDCVSIHSVSFQLPLNTRVTSLKIYSRDNEDCTTNGQVQKIEEARETFLETAARGLPTAYIEQQDSFTYSLQVAIPPLGYSNVEVVLEELLLQRLGKVDFQIPFTPNEDVDQIALELTIEDVNQDPTTTELYLDIETDVVPITSENATNIAKFYLDLPDAREYELPKVLRGWYYPNDIPESGILYTDGKCFEHFFQPTTLQPMRKNLFFVIDTSYSMRDYDKLSHAKNALKNFISTLTPDDTFTIQTFASRGTEKLFGSAPGTAIEITRANEFLDNLELDSYYTNLHEALLEALLRAKADAQADESNDDSRVTIVVLLSDGGASTGETHRPKIASDIYKLNREGKVKLFSLGFQGHADMELLNAIAIMNGGVSSPILGGTVDFATQIENFLNSQFGSVLLSNVTVDIQGGDVVNAIGETQQKFPVLADGYEIVVRGLLENENGEEESIVLSPTTTVDNSYLLDSLRAITSASTTDGIQVWTTTPVLLESTAGLNDYRNKKNSLCLQSYAHARITELMRYREAAIFIDDDMVMQELVALSEACSSENKLADCIEQEALMLAIEASVVVKGLTGMVTVDDDKCQSIVEDETDICLDGTNSNHYEYAVSEDGSSRRGRKRSETAAMSTNGSGGTYSKSGGSHHTNSSIFPSLIFTVVFWIWFLFDKVV